MRTSKNKYFLSIPLATLLLSGCLGTRHLQEGQQRLYRQHIEVPKPIDRTAVREHLTQHPNKTLPFTPVSVTVGFYYFGKMFYNKDRFDRKKEKVIKKIDAKIIKTDNEKKITNLQYKKLQRTDKFDDKIENGNTLMQWGESVSVFDSSEVAISIERIKSYLYTRGYFLAEVKNETKTTQLNHKLIKSKYIIAPGSPYTIDSIIYHSIDPRLDTLLHRDPNSLLQKGQIYNEDILTRERDRIDLYFKDRGYYDFSKQYVEYNLDTAVLGRRRIIMMIDIKPSQHGPIHPVFTVDSVFFTTDANVQGRTGKRQTLKYSGIDYRFYEQQFSPKILTQRVFITPGSLYSRSRTFETQRQLANLDAFKFVNINYDTSGGNFVGNIYTSPLNRYEWSNEAGVNVTEGYPGPFYSINLKRRNLFGGLENFDFNGRIGFEGVSSATQSQNVYRSIEAGVNGALTFPQFIFPLGKEAQLRFGNYNPRTKTQIGYNYTKRPEYERSNTSGSITYLWETQHTTQFSFTLTNVNIISTPFKSAEFDSLLNDQAERGNLSLSRSFNPSFVSSMIFGVTRNNNNYGNRETTSSLIRTQFESGGTTLNFLNTDLITDRGLEYFKYLRLSFDYRKNIIINSGTSLAYRFNGGVAYPYSKNKTLPYEKFFFAGGHSSVRAWQPRRLGWGSLPPEVSSNPKEEGYFDYSFEKPGEILLEGSAELRKDLFAFVEGAVFLDAGNVWWFEELDRPDGVTYGSSKFGKDFYKEMGVGTGFGLRFDFTFLILRFDVGIKMYDPARPAKDKFVLDNVDFLRPYGSKAEPVIFNVAIGYPF